MTLVVFISVVLTLLVSAELGFVQIIPEPLVILPMVFVAIPEAIACGIILVGMSWYVLTCDRSPAKPLWITLFLFTAWCGATFYFYNVYRKQVNHLPQDPIESGNFPPP